MNSIDTIVESCSQTKKNTVMTLSYSNKEFNYIMPLEVGIKRGDNVQFEFSDKDKKLFYESMERGLIEHNCYSKVDIRSPDKGLIIREEINKMIAIDKYDKGNLQQWYAPLPISEVFGSGIEGHEI